MNTNAIQVHPAFLLILNIVITVGVVLLAFWIVGLIFRKVLHSQDKIHIRYTQTIIRVVIIALAVFWLLSSNPYTSDFGRILFQGTAVFAAVIGLAAQPVISDLICGFMISTHKPFNIGDRIQLEDGREGIVKDITARHVVLLTWDTQMLIIPNSKLNAMWILNNSFETSVRSIQFRFPIAYGSDVEKAMTVIRNAVMESRYSIPGKPIDGESVYPPVYFLAYEECSLTMATTVYYHPTVPSEVVKSDINLRVKHALEDNGIEIPYPYLNVVMRGKTEKEAAAAASRDAE